MFQGEPSPDWRDLKNEQNKNDTDIGERRKRRCEKVYAKRAAKVEEKRRVDSNSDCGRKTPPYFSGNPNSL
ncbi:unnamed protein product [Allacma fusca]|uniref:Uncharacterized protein n=1 Tax=Allacma fusca TaxID=39272 RepID=A0A8J2JH30_9HEXA|nr:unnamed protein product [Allacma fusca]